MPTRWNIRRAFVYGAGFGAVYSLGKAIFVDGGGNLPWLAGMTAGGAIGGALLFSFVAWMRNLFGRAA